MATYVVDKRTGSDSNTGLSTAQAWKTLKKVNSSVPTGEHTVEVVEGSGPYLVGDIGNSNVYYFNPSQGAGAAITYNFNGNEFRGDVNANDPSLFAWHRSAASGKQDWFYITALAGTVPKVPGIFEGVPTTLPQVKSAVVDGWWSAASTNLTSAFTRYGGWLTNNWAWGDFDSLGFSTLYVLLDGGLDPSLTDAQIWMAARMAVLFAGGVAGSLHTVNDATLRGASFSIAQPPYSMTFNRCNLYNADEAAIYADGATILQEYKLLHSIVKDCGHEAAAQVARHNFDIYHCHISGCHTVAKMLSNTACTLNYYNNTTKNLLAGVIQKDVATPTLNEDYNQHHIDPDTTHAGAAIAFTGGTRQWTTTGAHDFPASTATSSGPSATLDMVDADGSIPNGQSRLAHAAVLVSGVNDSGQEDIAGNASGDYPNIGADQFDYAPGFGPWTPFDATMPTLSLAPTAPGDLKQVQTWKKVATAREIDSV